MIIPTETELLGRRIRVYKDSDLIKARKGFYGYTNTVNCDIHIATSISNTEVPKEEQEITYLHEVIHILIAKLGYEEALNGANIDLEKFVEDFAIGIHQIITKAVL